MILVIGLSAAWLLMKRNKIETPDYKEKYSSLEQHASNAITSKLMFTPIFFFRRFFLALVAVFGTEAQSWSI